MIRPATLPLVLAACTLPLFAQVTPEPDVIVSDITDTFLWGTAYPSGSGSSITAYSIGTAITNAGTMAVTWNPNTNVHPVITQNLYRLKNGRFQQIGMSWVKHAGSSVNGTTLNVNGTDVSNAVVNGSQAQLGPRNEVNAATGGFAYPVAGSYPSPSSVIDRRLQVLTSDVNPYGNNAGALYFVEAQVIHPEDASSNLASNNASYRAVSVTPGTNQLTFGGPTQQMKPAIQAWQDADPAVQLAIVDVPGDGRVIVGFKGTPTQPGWYHYEYAVQNLTSDRGVGSFSVEMWPGKISPQGTGLPGAPYHSGEPYSNSLWNRTITPLTQSPGSVTWKATTYASDPNASALRFGSLYNFAFDTFQLPGNVTLGLFKPGTPATITLPPFNPPRRPMIPYVASSSPSGWSDFVDISTTGSPGPIGNDNSFAVPIGFTFPFYFHGYTSVVISTNGYLTFPGQDGNVALNRTLPSPGNPHGVIAGYWDDLDCSHLFDIRYQTINNQFVVLWNCTHAGDTQPLQFELILSPDGSIVNKIVECPNTIAGASATRGIESPTGPEGLLHSHNSPYSAIPGQTVRYDRNTTSSDLFVAGSNYGGPFKLIYSSAPNTPIITMVSLNPTPTSLGPLGVLPVDLSSAIGVSDCYGLLTGVPDPTAVTNSNGWHEFDVWVPQSTFAGWTVHFYLCGVDFPVNPAETMNGLFNISNLVTVPG